MLHFSKDDNAFVRFALKPLHSNKDVRKLKQVGVNMESAIYNGFQHHFQDLDRLLYGRHLSKGDESKLVKLLAKTNLDASRRKKSSSEILKDIYGNCAGGFYQFGFVEATDKSGFKHLNISLSRRNWNHYAQPFMIGLEEKEVTIL